MAGEKLSDMADILRHAIERDERSYYQLAKDCGVNHSILIRFVAGERDIVLGTASKISKALGLSLKKD